MNNFISQNRFLQIGICFIFIIIFNYYLFFLYPMHDPISHNRFVSKTLGSNMVLQRGDSPASLYGHSVAPSALITVTLSDGQHSEIFNVISSATPSSAGDYFWIVKMRPTEGSKKKYTITIVSSANEKSVLENIVFGDVYLCSGQSNMQFSVSAAFDAESLIAEANNYSFIRIFSVGQDNSILQETRLADDLISVERVWLEGSSDNINGPHYMSYFSAVCWQFGKEIYENTLHKEIPVGLISSTWSGSMIEAWSPLSVLTNCEKHEDYIKIVEERTYRKRRVTGQFGPNQPSILYNTMITPFRHMKLTAVVWYQGESNVVNVAAYSCLQIEMIKAWRSAFQQKLFFIYTQLAAWNNGGGDGLSAFRLQQETIMLTLPKLAMASAADLGDPNSPFNPIHPRNKVEVGRRLAIAAAHLVYNIHLPFRGPEIESVTSFRHKTRGYAVNITFNTFSCGSGIHIRPVQLCPASMRSIYRGCGLTILEYSYKDSFSVNAEIEINDCGMMVYPTQNVMDRPATQLYYGIGDIPLLKVYNSWGIPLLPFKMLISS